MPIPRFLIAAAMAMLAVPATARDVCFTEADNARLPFAVFQWAPPPAPDASGYVNFPLTAAATMQLGRLAGRGDRYQRYYFQWANRSNAPLRSPAGRLLPRKPNIQPAYGALRRQRTAFTSIVRANDCTLAQTASVLGHDDEARAYARRSGVKLQPETTQPDGPGQGPDDICVIAAGTLPAGATGVVLDYEAQDGRSAAQTMAFLTEFSDLAHRSGLRAVLLINPFDAPSHRYSGIGAANANAIVRMFDLTTVWLWSRNRQGDLAASYNAQMAMIRQGGPVDPKRLIVDFDLNGTTLEDARFVRQAILRDGLAGVILWRNTAALGGACSSDVNRKIAALVLGDPASRPADQERARAPARALAPTRTEQVP